MSTAAELTFLTLNLPPNIQSAVVSRGYTVPTPIQAQTIPFLLEGRDVLGQASTGTGKTAAFALPLLSRLDLNSRLTQVIVLCPTRELAIQVARSFADYGDDLPGLNVQPIYGGASYYNQIKELKRGCQVVVGTPGRVMDHMRRGTLNLENLKCLVLDEADEMLRMGFVDDVKWILEQTPAARQVALFSATMPDAIRRIANEHLKNPATVTIRSETKVADTIRSRYLVAPFREKTAALIRILETEKTDGVIVFVKTKETTLKVADELLEQGYSAIAINGDIVQKQREHTIDQLRSGKLDILVATDVAARGLDVQRISHVINYDIPHDSEAWIHRIGRTGRAGRQGEAILFLTPAERRHLRSLERATRQSIVEMEFPSARAVNERRTADLQERLRAATSAPQFDMFRQLLTEIQQSSGMATEDLLGAVGVLMQGDRPFFMQDVRREARPVVRSREFSRDGRGDRFGQGQERERGRDRTRGPRGQAPSDERPRHNTGRPGPASFDHAPNRSQSQPPRREEQRPVQARPVVHAASQVSPAQQFSGSAPITGQAAGRPAQVIPAAANPGQPVVQNVVVPGTAPQTGSGNFVAARMSAPVNAEQGSRAAEHVSVPVSVQAVPHDVATAGVPTVASPVNSAAAEQAFAMRDFRRPPVNPGTVAQAVTDGAPSRVPQAPTDRRPAFQRDSVPAGRRAERGDDNSRDRGRGDTGRSEFRPGRPGSGAPRGEEFRGGDSRSFESRSPGTRGPRSEPGMETFRLEVGHEHGVQPGNIVGAIANEAGIDSKNIGRINIQEDHCFVDLPVGMPVEIFRGLKDVVVMGRHLRISRTGGNAGPSRPRGAGGGVADRNRPPRRRDAPTGSEGLDHGAQSRGRGAGKPGRGQGGVRGKASRGPGFRK